MLGLRGDFGADEVPRLVVADHLRAADSTKGTQGRQQINGFEDIRLALRVVAEDQMEARREIDIQARVISKIPQAKMVQMHAGFWSNGTGRQRRSDVRAQPMAAFPNQGFKRVG